MRRRRRGCAFGPILWIFIILAALWGIKWGMATYFPMPYGDMASEAAADYDVDKALLYAVMKAESNFDEGALSPKGARGLMQMMPETAKWCGEKTGIENPDLLNPRESIRVGAYYLAYLINRYEGDERVAVAAYNAGHGRVDSWLSDKAVSPDGKTLSAIPYPETEKYVKKVMLFRKIYEKRLAP